MNQKMVELTSAIEAETEGATEKLQLYINCCSRDEGQVRGRNNLGQQRTHLSKIDMCACRRLR